MIGARSPEAAELIERARSFGALAGSLDEQADRDRRLADQIVAEMR
jgi:hypothetical protein|tara:strand:+ start:414 stop:551 length:138 start_codon:yes stop_codon:yes gene_type:complete